MNDLFVLILKDAVWSSLAAVGFAILFNTPPKALLGCALAGAIGHSVRTLLVHEFGFGIELGTLIGAVVIGLLGTQFARRWKVPAMIFTVSGAITMVPGAFAYRTMIGLLTLVGENNTPEIRADILVTTVVNGVKTGLILGAIAGGIISPTMMFQREKPVV